jgi:DNA repair protein SbcC/Rad50
MQVTIKKLRLSYFKGVKSLEIDFSDEENFIYGKNEAGKTTVFDSLWFLFFGKDSTGRADFSIKTLDTNNQVIEKVDHEVEGTFLINGNEKTFKRVYKEQWSRTTDTLTGHTTDYHVDGFPVRTEKEYKEIVSQFFSEDLFKLLTNPLFFNSMKPVDRRSALISLVSEITNEEVFDCLPTKVKKSVHTQTLEQLLREGKKLDQIRLKAAQDKKTYREEKDSIPGRIDEAERSKPEQFDFEELQEIIAGKKSELLEIETKIMDSINQASLKNKAIQQWQNSIFEHKTKLQKLEFNAEQELRRFQQQQNSKPQEIKEKLEMLQSQAGGSKNLIAQKNGLIRRGIEQIGILNESLANLNNQRGALRQKWTEENAVEFTWNGETCTACNRPLDGAQAMDAEEKARANFNYKKKFRLDEIQADGKSIKSKIESIEQDIAGKNESIALLQEEITMLSARLLETEEDLKKLEQDLNNWYANPQIQKTASDFLAEEYFSLKQEIERMEASKPEEVKPDISKFEESKKMIQNSLEELQKALGNKDTIERINKRIEELKQTEKELAQKISATEGIEEACFTFSKARMELIESAINAKFDLVSFKMFEMQINGNEREICETIYKGVPFADLNTAGKIQAGLDIINALSRHYNTYLPIFIDNRESVHWIPQLNAQVVNLIADATAPELAVTRFHKELIEK